MRRTIAGRIDCVQMSIRIGELQTGGDKELRDNSKQIRYIRDILAENKEAKKLDSAPKDVSW